MFGTALWHDRDGCRVLTLVGQEVVIGRSPSHAIMLTARQASRQHARLFCVDGQYFVEDLSSQNGTRCDGIRLEGGRPLTGQHLLEIGDHKIEIEIKPQADTQQTAPSNLSWYREHGGYWFRCWWRISWTQFAFGWGWEKSEA